MFSGIVLTNSNDGGGGTRSTGDFTVYGSNDFVNMTVLVTGTLPDPGATTVSRGLFICTVYTVCIINIKNCARDFKTFVQVFLKHIKIKTIFKIFCNLWLRSSILLQMNSICINVIVFARLHIVPISQSCYT